MTETELPTDELLFKSSVIISRHQENPHMLTVMRGFAAGTITYVPCERCQALIRVDGDARENSAGYVLHLDGDTYADSFCQVMGLFCSETCKQEYQERVAGLEREGRGGEFTLRRRSRILDDAVYVMYCHEETREKE